ncbi:cation:dicarboxylate symporter family transporter [Candidatus Bealeia paramacronuclearis]
MAFVILFGSLMPNAFAEGAYTLSLLIKEFLMWVLPFAVMIYITFTLSQFQKQAFALVFILLIFEALSNALSVNYAWGIGALLEDMFRATVTASIVGEPQSLSPYFTISFLRPSFWSASKGTYIGLGLGLILAFSPLTSLQRGLEKCKTLVDFIFQKIFTRFVPFFVFGFLLNIQKSGHVSSLWAAYGLSLIWIVGAILAYLVVLYGISSGFRLKVLIAQLKNTLPTGLIAFTSASSAATMPFTIEAARKNVHNPDFASMVIPATTNIQQIGDCIANALFGIVLMLNHGIPFPDASTWIPFMVLFVLARYTTAAVMGGAIFIVLPLFEAYLGFTPEMLALLLAFNIIMDPIITASNVLANGSLCITFEKVWRIFQRCPLPQN